LELRRHSKSFSFFLGHTGKQRRAPRPQVETSTGSEICWFMAFYKISANDIDDEGVFAERTSTAGLDINFIILKGKIRWHYWYSTLLSCSSGLELLKLLKTEWQKYLQAFKTIVSFCQDLCDNTQHHAYYDRAKHVKDHD
jgi:hypothetical protein